MKKIRLYYWLLVAYIRRHPRRLAVSVLVIVLFVLNFKILENYLYKPFFGFANSTFAKPVIVEGEVGTVKVINPIFATSSTEKELSQLVFRGLTKTNDTGNVIPDIAESVNAVTDKEFIFNIRKDVYWHDGKHLDADDVIYTYQALTNPDLSTAFESSFRDVQVEKVDDFTVRFKLKETFSPFLAQTSIGIIPEHIPLKKLTPVGTGNFKVIAFNKDRVVLESKEIKLIVKFYASADLAIYALKQGEIQNLGGLSADQVKEFRDWPNLKVIDAIYGNRYIGVFFNTKSDLLTEKSTRQALLYAIDKKKILNQESGQSGEPALTSIGRNSWARTNEVHKYEQNIDTARNLIGKGGWKLEGDTLRKAGNAFVLNIAYLDAPNFNSVVDLIGEDLAKIGIKLNKHPYSSSQIRDQIIKSRDFDLVITAHELNPDPDQYVFWHSTQANLANITGLSSARLDKTLEDGRKTIKLEERKSRYNDFERSLTDEAPALFLYYPKYYYIIPNDLEGVDLSHFDSPIDRFNSVKNWKVRYKLMGL